MHERVESLAASEGRLFVLLQVRGEPFALPSAQVRAVSPVGRITRIPHAPREVGGVTNWRGKVLTLYDLGEALGLPGKSGLAPYTVVLALGNGGYDVGVNSKHWDISSAGAASALEPLSSAR